MTCDADMTEQGYRDLLEKLREGRIGLFRPPEIPAASNVSGRDVWYDQSSLCWTLAPQPRASMAAIDAGNYFRHTMQAPMGGPDQSADVLLGSALPCGRVAE